MPDASRFPAGLVIEGDLAVARPLNTIVRSTSDGLLYVSTNATVATYSALSAAGSAVTEVADPGSGNAITGITSDTAIYFQVAATGETNTLPAPTVAGVRLFLCMDSEQAGTDTRIVTAAGPINVSNNTVMTFNGPTEGIWLVSTEFRGNGTSFWRWIEDINFGVTLS